MPFLPPRLTAALLTTALTGAGLGLLHASPASAAGNAVDLGRASSFAVLASSTVTNTGNTVVTGDLGLAPGTSVTGFPPGQVIGTTHVADATATGAQTDARAAFTTATGLAGTAAAPEQLGGTTLFPGVYDRGALDLTGNLVLDAQNDPNAIFVLRAASTLTTAASSTVTLRNGADPCHVFWAVGSSATLGADSVFVGTIDAEASISLDARAAVSGRLLALTGAVTLIDNAVTRPVCAAAVAPAPAPAPVAPAPEPTASSTPAPTPTPTPTPTPAATPTASPTPTASSTPTTSASPTASPPAGSPTASATPTVAPTAPSPAATAAPLAPAPTAAAAAPAPDSAPIPDSGVLSDGRTVPNAVPRPEQQEPASPTSPTSPGGGPDTALPVTGTDVRDLFAAAGLALLVGTGLMAAGASPRRLRRPLLRARRSWVCAAG